MGEEAFDETIISNTEGTVWVRGGYGRKTVWLGVASHSDPEGDPEVLIPLSPRQQQAVVDAIEPTTFVTVQNALEQVRRAKLALDEVREQIGRELDKLDGDDGGEDID